MLTVGSGSGTNKVRKKVIIKFKAGNCAHILKKSGPVPTNMTVNCVDFSLKKKNPPEKFNVKVLLNSGLFPATSVLFILMLSDTNLQCIV